VHFHIEKSISCLPIRSSGKLEILEVEILGPDEFIYRCIAADSAVQHQNTALIGLPTGAQTHSIQICNWQIINIFTFTALIRQDAENVFISGKIWFSNDIR
jgi:hypothetical protein